MSRTTKEKQDIEIAIINYRYACIRYYKTPNKDTEKCMQEMCNKLYDAIGGMDDYKFEVEGD